MKKIFLMIAAIALILNANAQDKAFEKGNVVVGLGAGFGFYKTKIHSEQTFGGVKYSDDTTDFAGSAIFPLMVEYGVTNWLGIGGKFAFSNYFEETDSVSGNKSTTRAIDAGLLINFHLVKSKRFDMPIVVNVGYSNFKITNNDIYDSQAKDNGMVFGIELQPRIYFGDHVGMYFNVGYAGYSYPSIEFSDNQNYYSTNNFKFTLKGSGVNLGIGLIGKF